MDVLDFSHGNVYQGKVASETTNFSWVCLDMPSHAQTCLDLLGVPLGSLSYIAR